MPYRCPASHEEALAYRPVLEARLGQSPPADLVEDAPPSGRGAYRVAMMDAGYADIRAWAAKLSRLAGTRVYVYYSGGWYAIDAEGPVPAVWQAVLDLWIEGPPVRIVPGCLDRRTAEAALEATG